MAPGRLERRERLAEAGHRLRLDALGEEAPGHADAEAPGLAGEGLGEVGNGRARARGVARVVAEQGRTDEGRVFDGEGEGADLVERGGEGHEPVAAHATPGGLEADDAAERRGLADRAAGVGAEGDGHHPRGHRGGRPARGAARHAARSHGLRVGFQALFSVDEPMANSSMFVLPTTIAPRASSRATAVAAKGGR